MREIVRDSNIPDKSKWSEIGLLELDGKIFLADDSDWPIHARASGNYLYSSEKVKELRERQELLAQKGFDVLRREAYQDELGDIYEQFDNLVKGIASAETLQDIKELDVVSVRMDIKRRIPKR